MTEQQKQILQRSIDTLASAVNLIANHQPCTADINVNSLCMQVDTVVFGFLGGLFDEKLQND